MKKILFTSIFIVAFAAFILYEQFSGNSNTPAIVTDNKNIATSTEIQTSLYKNGNYTGNVADAFYGKLQVEAIIQNGKITDIQFLVYPNTPGHTSEISASSLPILKTEAIASQSANVDIVSGATQTSEAFKESLKTALILAQK